VETSFSFAIAIPTSAAKGAASLAGVDVPVLTGGIGKHDRRPRQELEEALDWLSPLEILVVPADQEGLMARSGRHAAAA
jgi:acetate kinase